MKKVNLLSKAEMRKVMGGNPPVGGENGPGDPDGGDGNGNYMCCWAGTTNCSRCVLSYAGAKCPDAGAVLTAC
jgi:hypothetical protein